MPSSTPMRANSRPKPLPAPVMTATLSRKSCIVDLSLVVLHFPRDADADRAPASGTSVELP